MILISHRGNTNGRMESWENEPTYIDLAIKKGYDVEIDIWVKDRIIYLGHDNPQYGIDFRWIKERSDKLWIHCKNTDAIILLKSLDCELNYFWHEKDRVTLTSKGFIWTYPGNQPILGSIAVLPEMFNDEIISAIGICSDIIESYNLKPETF